MEMNILVISSKKAYIAERLKQEACKQGFVLEIFSVADLKKIDFKPNFESFDVLYIRNPYLNSGAEFLPQIIRLAKEFKKRGKKVVDAVIAEGKLGEGKWADYQRLLRANLPIPKTHELTLSSISVESYPLILKWQFGMKAENVFYVKNSDQLAKLTIKYPKKEWLVQEFIPADYEYKVMVVGFNSVPVVLRFNVADSGFGIKFRTGVSISVKDCSEVVKLAEKSAKILGRELSKVDILESRGKFYVLEVNRFPGVKPFENLTKYNLVGDFMEYLQNGSFKV